MKIPPRTPTNEQAFVYLLTSRNCAIALHRRRYISLRSEKQLPSAYGVLPSSLKTILSFQKNNNPKTTQSGLACICDTVDKETPLCTCFDTITLNLYLKALTYDTISLHKANPQTVVLNLSSQPTG